MVHMPDNSKDISVGTKRGGAVEEKSLTNWLHLKNEVEIGQRKREWRRGGEGRCHQTGGAVENKRGSTLSLSYLSEGLIHRWLC